MSIECAFEGVVCPWKRKNKKSNSYHQELIIWDFINQKSDMVINQKSEMKLMNKIILKNWNDEISWRYCDKKKNGDVNRE